MRYIWEPAPFFEEISADIASSYHMDPAAAALVARRLEQNGMTPEEYLNPQLDHLHTPYLLPDMDKAVAVIRESVRKKDKICVHGDYDVDGMTATVLLVRCLSKLGGDVTWYIPHRMEEGYGLSSETVSQLHSLGIDLLITVDCGITAFKPVKEARERGMKVIITDHHVPEEEFPEAHAVINPKRNGYPFPDLAGVGVALKLAQALTGTLDRSDLELAAFGTVADIVPLVGENRVIVSHGLKQVSSPFLKRLAEKSGADPEKLSAYDIGFRMAPRINSVGRLGRPGELIPLFLEEEQALLETGISRLDSINEERRGLEKEITGQARLQAEEVPPEESFFLALAGKGWHNGVLGIVASRICDEFNRPVLVMNREGDLLRGSGRSIPGIDLLALLRREGDLFHRLGGHSQAVGFSLPASRLPLLRQRVNSALREEGAALFTPRLRPDLRIRPGHLNWAFIESLEMMQPFGLQNPRPLVVVDDIVVREKPGVAGSNHLKFRFDGGEGPVHVIGFSMGQDCERISSRVSLAGFPEKNVFNGQTTLQFRLKDWANNFQKAEELERSRFVRLFRTIMKYTGATLKDLIREEDSLYTENLLMIFEEMGVVTRFGERYYISTQNTRQKIPFESSTLYCRWKEALER